LIENVHTKCLNTPAKIIKFYMHTYMYIYIDIQNICAL
jgi:hypothetical protein